MPMPDDQGKGQTNYFDFTITSKTSSTIKIPYYITAKRKGNDNSLDSSVKLYLTEVTNKGEQNESESPITLQNNQTISKFSGLSTYTNSTLNIDATKNEKVLYVGTVPKNTANYTKDYRLRMWVSNDAVYSQTETGTCSDPTYTTEEACIEHEEDWTITATNPSKTFTATINVYAEGESDLTQTLAQMILADNTLITTQPTLTGPSTDCVFNSATGIYDDCTEIDAGGLYSMNVTNGFGGKSTQGTTYYFRGNVENNKVRFANLDWRVVRINEDGTVRIILQDSLGPTTCIYNAEYYGVENMYYSNSVLKTCIDRWYTTNITEGDDSKVVSGNYYCEAAKVSVDDPSNAGNANMTLYNSYTPDLVCQTDGNTKGLINSKVGLITYDEAILAGEYYDQSNYYCYLTNEGHTWTTSPAGASGHSSAYAVSNSGAVYARPAENVYTSRPVINLKADTTATKDANGVYLVQ